MKEEQYLYECLRRLQEQYHKDAEPYLKRLAQLKSFETPSLYMSVAEYERHFGTTEPVHTLKPASLPDRPAPR